MIVGGSAPIGDDAVLVFFTGRFRPELVPVESLDLGDVLDRKHCLLVVIV